MRLHDVIGQTALARLLTKLIARDRLPHAVLLEGVPGCGRRTLALALAQALLCTAPVAGEACGQCPSCRLCAAGNHPDLVALAHDRGEKELPVDTVRDEVAARATESALIGTRRVFILYGVERLSGSSANVLLKTLEEPPSGVYLLMTTAQVATVMTTVRSRAQVFRLQPLGTADIAKILVAGGVDPAEASARAKAAPGSHRGLWDGGAPAPLEALRKLFRDGLREELVAEVVSHLPSGLDDDMKAAGITEAMEQRRALRSWLQALAQDQLLELRAKPTPALAARVQRLALLHQDLDRNLAPRLVVEALGLG
jgi:DNA polymerase III delta' subunit